MAPLVFQEDGDGSSDPTPTQDAPNNLWVRRLEGIPEVYDAVKGSDQPQGKGGS